MNMDTINKCLDTVLVTHDLHSLIDIHRTLTDYQKKYPCEEYRKCLEYLNLAMEEYGKGNWKQIQEAAKATSESLQVMIDNDQPT